MATGPQTRQSSPCLAARLEQRLQSGKWRVRGVARLCCPSIGVTAVGFDLFLMLVVVTIDAEQLPVAAVGRIVIMIVIAVMNGQFTQVGQGKLPGATTANPRIYLESAFPIAIFPGFAGLSRIQHESVKAVVVYRLHGHSGFPSAGASDFVAHYSKQDKSVSVAPLPLIQSTIRADR